MLSINNSINRPALNRNKKLNPNFKRYDSYSSTSSKTKKAAVGFASFAIPGLGQVING